MIIWQIPYIDINGKEHPNLVKYSSNAGMHIRQVETGIIYTEAVDILPCKYTYEETDIPIKEDNKE